MSEHGFEFAYESAWVFGRTPDNTPLKAENVHAVAQAVMTAPMSLNSPNLPAVAESFVPSNEFAGSVDGLVDLWQGVS
jgi:hypothetical protein